MGQSSWILKTAVGIKTQKWKMLRTSLFGIRDKCAPPPPPPPTPTPKCSCTPRHLKHQFISWTNVESLKNIIKQKISSGGTAGVISSPSPPLLTSTWKWVTLGDLSPDTLVGRCRYMMANKLIRALFVYSLALFYGFMVCFSLLLSAIRKLEIPRRGKRREKRK